MKKAQTKKPYPMGANKYSNINYLNIKEADLLPKEDRVVLVYKYMPYERAKTILDDKGIYFANPTEWEDPFEKRFVNALYEMKSGDYVNFPWRNRVFCACFTIIPESEAHWILYSRAATAVRLNVCMEQLLKELDDWAAANKGCKVYVGRVRYKSAHDIEEVKSPGQFKNDDVTAKFLLLKRKAYSFEKELRVMIVKDKAPADEKRSCPGIVLKYQCDFKELFPTITIDPRLSDGNKESMLRKLFGEHDENKGNNPKVIKSRLYKPVAKRPRIKMKRKPK